jgi:glycosyltransferase involved in cell wall biosynthesis
MSKELLTSLFVSSWYPNRTNPTLGNFVQKHAEASALKNKVIVLAIFPDPSIHTVEITEKTKGNLTEIIVYFPKKVNGNLLLAKLQSIRYSKKAFRLACDLVLLKYGKPNIIHLNVIYPLGIWCIALKKKWSIPLVISEHSSGFHPGVNAYSSLILKSCKRVLLSADHIMPVSQDLANRLLEYNAKVKCTIVPNVVNESIFHPSSSVESNKLVHISTAFEPAKNINGMLHAVNILALKKINFTFHIISDGDVKIQHELARELGLLNSKVFFYPTMTTQEVADFIRTCSALVLFSNFENFPCVIPEAFMSGIPVISTPVNGIPEYVNASNGIFIPVGDEGSLADAMLTIINEEIVFPPKDLQDYALDKFSYASVGDQFETIYRSLVSI